jgi:hypothetical protein
MARWRSRSISRPTHSSVGARGGQKRAPIRRLIYAGRPRPFRPPIPDRKGGNNAYFLDSSFYLDRSNTVLCTIPPRRLT